MINRSKISGITFALAIIVVSGCSSMPSEQQFPKYHTAYDAIPATGLPMKISASERMAYPAIETTAEIETNEVLYSFVISNMDIHDGLRQFARAYDLNIAIDRDVTGILDVDFRDVSLDKALSLMLDNLDFYWRASDGVIRVRSQETRRFDVDYLRLVRSGVSSSAAIVSSSSGESGGGEEASDAGSININQTDEIKFWEELEEQLSILLTLGLLPSALHHFELKVDCNLLEQLFGSSRYLFARNVVDVKIE